MRKKDSMLGFEFCQNVSIPSLSRHEIRI
jgi:hypothetical protein